MKERPKIYQLAFDIQARLCVAEAFTELALVGRPARNRRATGASLPPSTICISAALPPGQLQSEWGFLLLGQGDMIVVACALSADRLPRGAW